MFCRCLELALSRGRPCERVPESCAQKDKRTLKLSRTPGSHVVLTSRKTLMACGNEAGLSKAHTVHRVARYLGVSDFWKTRTDVSLQEPGSGNRQGTSAAKQKPSTNRGALQYQDHLHSGLDSGLPGFSNVLVPLTLKILRAPKHARSWESESLRWTPVSREALKP